MIFTNSLKKNTGFTSCGPRHDCRVTQANKALHLYLVGSEFEIFIFTQCVCPVLFIKDNIHNYTKTF